MFQLVKRLRLVDWLYFFCAVAFIVLQVWLDIKVVDYTRNILLIIQAGGAIEQILEQGAYMLACALISLLGAVLCGFFFAMISTSFLKMSLGVKIWRPGCHGQLTLDPVALRPALSDGLPFS